MYCKLCKNLSSGVLGVIHGHLCTALHTIVLLFSSILCHVLVHTHDTTVIVLIFCTMYPSSEYIWSSGTGLPDCPSGVWGTGLPDCPSGVQWIIHPEYRNWTSGLSIRSSGTWLPDCPSGVFNLLLHGERGNASWSSGSCPSGTALP